MKHIRKISILLALCLALTLLPITSATAAESGDIWLRHLPADGGVTMALVSDTSVASGVITITYDPNLLTFQGLTVDSAYVLAHAVNDKETGTVKISWVGTGADGGAYVLMRLQFAGDPLAVAALSGTVRDAAGNSVAITKLDFAAINDAMRRAADLKAEDYTADSFSALQNALEEANAAVAVETVTQAQADAAAQTVTAAMEALVVYVPEPAPTDPPATEPAPTDPPATEPAPTQPGSTPAPTEPAQTDPTPQPKGDNSWLLIVLALCVVAFVAVVVILKKRGNKK